MMDLRDFATITSQLKRIPKNAIEVVKRCSYGFPVVIKSFPISDGKPFPTLYWLTCPFMRAEISKIESNGGIRRYESFISSGELFHSHVQAHLLANRQVMNLVDDDMKHFFTGGMGGIRDFRHVKCLHMHVAYHLGGIENPVGAGVLSEIKMECESGICNVWRD